MQTPAFWTVHLVDIASIHAGVTGVLAGFSITLVVLLAIERTRETGAAPGAASDDAALTEAIVGVFLVSFVAFIAAAIQYAVVPQRQHEHQYLLYTLATTMYYVGGVLAFLGLAALLSSVRGGVLALLGGITFCGAVIGGYFAAAIPYQDLHGLRQRWVFAYLLLAVAVAGLFNFFTGRPGVAKAIEVGLYTCCGFLILVFAFSMLSFFLPEWVVGVVIASAGRGIPLVTAGVLTSTLALGVLLALWRRMDARTGRRDKT